MRLRWWLLFWLLLGFISHHPTPVINTLAVYRHRETDFCGGVRDHPGQHGKTPSPQKLDNLIIIIIEFLRPYTFTILFCTNYLCLSFLKTIFQSENGHDGSTDVQQRAWRSNRRRQEGNKIGLKDVITLRRHVKRKFRAKIHKRKVTTKINHHDKINGKRKTARKQKMFQRAQELRRRAEDYHKCKIPPPARKPLCNRVRMAAAEHRHSSGLPYWPYLTAETLKNRMGRQPPPPTQQRSITDNSLSLKTPPECLHRPLPPSVDDNIKECPLAPLPHSPLPPSVDDNLNECLLIPLPPSPLPPSVDDNLKECLLAPLPPSPLPPSVDDNLNECLLAPLPPSSLPPSVDDNLKECLLAPLPPSVDDNLKECLLAPLPPSPLPPSPLPPSVDDNLKECLLARLPPSVDDNLKECLLAPLPPSPLPPSVDDNLKECLLAPLPPSPLPPSVDDNLKTPPLATQEAEAEKPPKPKRWRVDEVEQSPKPKRRRADEVEQSPKPKRQREAETQLPKPKRRRADEVEQSPKLKRQREAETQLPKPKRRRLSKLRTRHCTQAWAIRINPWVEKKKKIKK
ncbi:nuclear pore complex-interacting protein family member B15-like isoform X2 [Pan troglodytes]|uniref:nuclear pore complex-interacting protein family member B15-like isoform X2 n=1 Tax=Pan troglodytes TaxID=9598 RepID=UPI0023F56916|nr:nuclear pore complex-interacting protein family member B15-like isoform X2 [Pan troglodytes]